MPGARSSVRQSPWGWGLSLASPGGLEGEARAAEGWGKARVMEGRSPFKGKTGPGRRSRETALSRGSPGDGDWSGKALGKAAKLDAAAGPPLLPPGATRPGLVSTPGRPRTRIPSPQHSAPCLQGPPGVPRRCLGGQHPLHTRTYPCARSPGWCSRRRWAASNTALRASPAQPPPPPRRSPPPRPRSLPVAPAQSGPRGHCSDAAGRAQRLGMQPAAAERPPSTMAVQASPAQSRRAAHSAASETPTGAPAILG